jgi:DNA-binding PadR family transcriptional regulator
MASTAVQLTPADWAVLALVAEGPTHGFAIARLMEPGGPVGQVWALRKPLVYRSLETLERSGLIAQQGTEPSSTGPPRKLMGPTAEGTRALAEWNAEPVDRVRDARSVLLLKLLFHSRAGRSPAPLLTAQRDQFRQRTEQLREHVGESDGFDRTLMLWRLESTEAALRFTEALLGEHQEKGHPPIAPS